MGRDGLAEPVEVRRVAGKGGDTSPDEAAGALLADPQHFLDKFFSRRKVVIQAAGLRVGGGGNIR